MKNLIIDESQYEQYYCNDLSSISEQNFSNLKEITLITDFYLDNVVASIVLKYPHLEVSIISPDKQFYRGYGTYFDAVRELGCGVERFSEFFKEQNI